VFSITCPGSTPAASTIAACFTYTISARPSCDIVKVTPWRCTSIDGTGAPAKPLTQKISSEFDERRKGRKRCECPITASGTLHGKYRRQSTGAWEWQAALAVVAAWEQAGSWTSPLQRPVVAKEIPSASRITITEATQGFLDKIKSRELAVATHGK
jgi:hypothetical protein